MTELRVESSVATLEPELLPDRLVHMGLGVQMYIDTYLRLDRVSVGSRGGY